MNDNKQNIMNDNLIIMNDNVAITMLNKANRILDDPVIKLNKVYVGQSRLHGLGVFAKKPIKRGEIITYYPPHYILLMINMMCIQVIWPRRVT
jgi:hypothetical protein